MHWLCLFRKPSYSHSCRMRGACRVERTEQSSIFREQTLCMSCRISYHEQTRSLQRTTEPEYDRIQPCRSADIPKIISEECCSLTASGRNFLEQCLVLNPHHRPGSTALLQHAWIKPYIEQVRADYMKFRTPPLELTSKSGRGAARRSMSLRECCFPIAVSGSESLAFPGSQFLH